MARQLEGHGHRDVTPESGPAEIIISAGRSQGPTRSIGSKPTAGLTGGPGFRGYYPEPRRRAANGPRPGGLRGPLSTACHRAAPGGFKTGAARRPKLSLRISLEGAGPLRAALQNSPSLASLNLNTEEAAGDSVTESDFKSP